MKLSKYIAALVCVLLLTGAFSGCGQPAKSPFVSADTPSPSVSASPTVVEQINYAGAYASLDPKTVMLTVDGMDVTWDEIYFYIYNAIANLDSNGIQITSWSAIYQDDVTFKDYVLDAALNTILQNAAIEYGAKQRQIALSAEDEAGIQAEWDAQVSAAGGEEAFMAKLSAAYCTKDILNHLQRLEKLYGLCFVAIYGENGSALPDQDVADYIAEDGYLMAKHILMMTSKADDAGDSIPMNDEEKAEVKEKMEGILTQLKAYKGDDFDAFFDQLMAQYSEDPGAYSYPDGYLFQTGEMVSQFENGTTALEIGQFSQELVETDYGYHIIYRLPINYDASLRAYASYGSYSLRYITARGMYDANLDTWLNSLEITYSDKYNALDFDRMFAVG